MHDLPNRLSSRWAETAPPMQAEQFVVIPGRGAASGQREYCEIGGALRAQKPLFKTAGLDLEAFFEGTINARLPITRFEIRRPLFEARNIVWLPGYPGENFDFCNCSVEFDGRVYPGLVYYPRPETKTAFTKPTAENMIEILAPIIPSLGHGSCGTLIIDSSQLELIY